MEGPGEEPKCPIELFSYQLSVFQSNTLRKTYQFGLQAITSMENFNAESRVQR